MATAASAVEKRDTHADPSVNLNAVAPSPAEYADDPSRSYWIREYVSPFDQGEKPDALPEKVDVVVIGSGITGASVVHEIAEQQPGLSVAVIEARGLCTGATGRNGGHLGRPNAYHVRELADMFGDAEAIRLREFIIRNKDLLIECIRKLGKADEVDLCVKGTIAVFKTAEERTVFVEDERWCRAKGMNVKGVVLSAEQTLQIVDMEPEMAQHGSVFLSDSGTIYPRKLVSLLFSDARDRMCDLSIHTYNPVTSVDYDPSNNHEYPYTISTEHGVVRSRAVFHATNAYCNRLIPELRSAETGVFGCRAHMLAVQPNVAPPTEKDTTMAQGFGYDDFWHWLFQRRDNGPFLHGFAEVESMGEYDDSVTLPADHPVRGTMLRFLEKAFPRKFQSLEAGRDIVADWTGIQGFTHNGSSIVGRPRKDSPAEWCSVGHNGEGMTRCFLAASMATQAMLAQMAGKSWKAPEWFPHSYMRNLEVDSP
ncbi:hypothetical protein LTS17_004277 [Exophiala oligosperma]